MLSSLPRCHPVHDSGIGNDTRDPKVPKACNIILTNRDVVVTEERDFIPAKDAMVSGTDVKCVCLRWLAVLDQGWIGGQTEDGSLPNC